MQRRIISHTEENSDLHVNLSKLNENLHEIFLLQKFRQHIVIVEHSYKFADRTVRSH